METNNKERQSLQELRETAKEINASTAHIVFEGFEYESNVTAVLSIYDSVKPSHVVLDDLYKWAEAFDPMVVKKIEELMCK